MEKIIVNEYDGVGNMYLIGVGTGTAFLQIFEVCGLNEQDALDLVADHCVANELEGLYSSYFALADMAELGETAYECAESFGLSCVGNTGVYMDIVSIEKI